MVRTSSITMPIMVGIVGCMPSVDEKVWCFFVSVCLSCFGITKFVITEMLWSSIITKTIMVSLYAGTFVVVHLYSTFSVDPQNFSTGANLYQKLWFFAIFADVCPHFKARTVKFGTTMRTWDSLHQAKFYKNRLRGYTPFGQIYSQN